MNTDRSLNVAVVGATGLVGSMLLDLLGERDFPVKTLFPLASMESAGETIKFQGASAIIQLLDQFDFAAADLAFFAVPRDVAATYIKKAADAGCVAIDISGHLADEGVSPVIAEVNPEILAECFPHKRIACPSALIVQLLTVLKPLDDLADIQSITVATYQSVAGAGKQGVNELAGQTAKLLNAQTIESNLFPHQIAFNVIPQVDQVGVTGYSLEELRIVRDTQKILGKQRISINPTCVRVPVFYGDAQSVHITTSKALSVSQATTALLAVASINVEEETGKYPTPQLDVVGKDEVYVGRLRQDLSSDRGLNLWIVSDNVRKGAGLNAVQIAELLIKSYL